MPAVRRRRLEDGDGVSGAHSNIACEAKGMGGVHGDRAVPLQVDT